MSKSTTLVRSAKDPEVGVHGNRTIRLAVEDATFYTEYAGDYLTAPALAALKGKIDAKDRQVARYQAGDLEAVILIQEGWASNPKWRWNTGTFVGINGHTGDVTFKVGGEEVRYSGVTVFRKGDPAIERVQELIRLEREAQLAANKATDEREAAERAHGYRPAIGRRRSHDTDKRRAATEEEQALVAFLKGEAAPAGEEA